MQRRWAHVAYLSRLDLMSAILSDCECEKQMQKNTHSLLSLLNFLSFFLSLQADGHLSHCEKWCSLTFTTFRSQLYALYDLFITYRLLQLPAFLYI